MFFILSNLIVSLKKISTTPSQVEVNYVPMYVVDVVDLYIFGRCFACSKYTLSCASYNGCTLYTIACLFSIFDVIDIKFANDTYWQLVPLHIRIHFRLLPDQIPDEYSSLVLEFYASILFRRIDLLHSTPVPAERRSSKPAMPNA